ncbi:MAG: hypothetical protein R2861_16295 [Desulfobacterales bacterium]
MMQLQAEREQVVAFAEKIGANTFTTGTSGNIIILNKPDGLTLPPSIKLHGL